MKKGIIQALQDTGITHKESTFNYYAPIAKISHNSTTHKKFVANKNVRIVQTEFGTVEIRNRLLVERHHKIIRAIIKHGTSTITPEGSIITFFKISDILRARSMGEKNYLALKNDIKYIADAQYYFRVGTFEKRVSIFKEHEMEDNLMGEKVQAVQFDKHYVEMHRTDFSANNKELFEKIDDISYSTIPSIIYHLIYRNKTDTLETYSLMNVLELIGYTMDSPNAIKTIRKNLSEFREELLSDYGIKYDDAKKTLSYKKLESIIFKDSEEITKESLRSYIGKIISYNKEKRLILNIANEDSKENVWTIKTNKSDIVLKYFLDDLVFLLDRITQENDNSLQNLFAVS